MTLGKSSSKTRGWISAERPFFRSSLIISVFRRMARGVSRSEANPARHIPMKAKATTGQITCGWRFRWRAWR